MEAPMCGWRARRDLERVRGGQDCASTSSALWRRLQGRHWTTNRSAAAGTERLRLALECVARQCSALAGGNPDFGTAAFLFRVRHSLFPGRDLKLKNVSS